MQGRFRLHAKALMFSITTACCGLMMVFFFYDGPVKTPHLLASAEATETEETPETYVDVVYPQQRKIAWNIALPKGFQPEWKTLRLDGRIPVQVLARKFRLAQTQDRAGSEYYDYAAYVFEQMAVGVSDKELAARLQTLSLQAQTLGNAVRQAAAIRYDGPPSEDMSHLQVRSAILFHLNDLNPAALITAQYNQHGQLVSQDKRDAQAGEALSSFLENARDVLNSPAAARYPESMKLVQKERDLLEKLSNHLTLRWESTAICHQSCDGATTRIRVYVRQTLPEKALTGS